MNKFKFMKIMNMRIFKGTLIVLTTLLVMWGCEEETFNAVLQEVPPPGEVNSEIVVATDNSGQVTVTPDTEGAISHEIFFGEFADEEPVLVGLDGTTTYTYASEGNFTIRIVGIAPDGRTSERTFEVEIILTGIANFESGFVQDPDGDLREVSFTPIADNTEIFEVLFGDEEDGAEPLVVENGQTIEHLYDFGDFVASFRAVNNTTGRSAEFSVPVSTGEPRNCPFAAPIDFENNEVFEPFNGSSFEIVPNPDLSGANPNASMVGAFTNAGANFEGFFASIPNFIDFSVENRVLRMLFWSDQNVRVRLDANNGVDGARAVQVIADHGGTGWEELVFDFNDATATFIQGDPQNFQPLVPDGQYGGINIFIAPGSETTGTFFIDNLGFCVDEDDMPMDDDMPPMDGNGDDCAFDAPLSFENNEDFFTFGGVTFEIVENPDPSGANPTVSQVGSFTNSGANFEGFGTTLPTPADFSGNNNVLRMLFWSDVSVSVRLDMTNGVNGERAVQVVTTHGGTGWEELVFDFNTATATFIDGDPQNFEPLVPDGQYAGITMFIEPGSATAGTFFIDELGFCDDSGSTGGGGDDTTADCAFEAPLSFENNEDFFTFGGVTFEIVENPDPSGANPTVSQVGSFTNSGANFEGFGTTLPTPADFSGNNNVLRMLFWSDVSVSVRLDMTNGVNGERAVQVVTTHGGTGWEELVFDFNTATATFIDGDPQNFEPLVPDGQYAGITMFIEPGSATAGTFFIDELGFCDN